MRVLPLADEVYSTGQLFERDLELLAKQGVRSIVNNRFDIDGNVPVMTTVLPAKAAGLSASFASN